MSCKLALDLSDGNLKGAPLVNDVPGALRNLFTTDSLTISKEVERADPVYCSEGGSCDRELISETTIGVAYTLSLTTRDINQKARELFTGGAAVAVLQTAALAETFQIASTVAGDIIPIGAKDISNYSLDETVPSGVFVEGVDYEINTTFGYIEILEGGNIADATDVTLTYDCGEITDGYTITTGGSCEDRFYQLVWLGRNKEGKDTMVTINKIELTPESERILKGETKSYGTFTITGKCLKPKVGEVYTEVVI